ncbi:hypothetical protein SASPL_124939 [Salvia splendens]|uniref:Aldose 1-epimerase n=1 Tax=Salvia splendens TaxID=180675 RepID=A0A8X8XHL9_SALSN|nr:hypothetical protein SASPL_124939 [Salvia splendens]
MEAKPLKKPSTPINQAPHTYWNLGGHANGNILSHEIHLASKIMPVDDRRSPLSRGHHFLQPHNRGAWEGEAAVVLDEEVWTNQIGMQTQIYTSNMFG